MPEAPYDLIATLFFMAVALGAVLYGVIGRLTNLQEYAIETREELCRLKAELLKAGVVGEEFTQGKETRHDGRYRASGGSRPGQNGRR